MARRRRQGAADGVVDAVARLPWWVGVALAGLSYLFFHWLATQPQATVTDARQIGGMLPAMMVAGFSRALQFLVPALCLLGAVISLVKRKKREALLTTVTQSASADALNGMSWHEFELLVGQGFRLQGYQVTEQGGGQADGGVDLVLRRGNESFLVQCKQWKALKVGVDVVRELYGVMAAQGAAGGFVVTSGRFTDDAMAFAAGRNVRLVDGLKLFVLLQQAQAAPVNGKTTAHGDARSTTPIAPVEVPVCPKCNAPMVLRTAKQGARTGSQFWGCSTFPACRGTR